MNPVERMQVKGIKILPIAGAVLLILGPLWGYIAMFICKLVDGGVLLDTITFYMMMIGWMMAPIGVLLLLYTIMAGSILNDRRDRVRR
jgi:hypothetical protein